MPVLYLFGSFSSENCINGIIKNSFRTEFLPFHLRVSNLIRNTTLARLPSETMTHETRSTVLHTIFNPQNPRKNIELPAFLLHSTASPPSDDCEEKKREIRFSRDLKKSNNEKLPFSMPRLRLPNRTNSLGCETKLIQSN